MPTLGQGPVRRVQGDDMMQLFKDMCIMIISGRTLYIHAGLGHLGVFVECHVP